MTDTPEDGAEIIAHGRLAYIHALYRKAYHGPWESKDTEHHWVLRVKGVPFQILKAPKHGTPYAEYWPDNATGDFITESITIVPELLDALERVDRERRWFRSAWDTARQCVHDATAQRDEARAETEQLRLKVADLDKRDAWLTALENAGVDNWDGCSHASDLMDEWGIEQP